VGNKVWSTSTNFNCFADDWEGGVGNMPVTGISTGLVAQSVASRAQSSCRLHRLLAGDYPNYRLRTSVNACHKENCHQQKRKDN